MTSPENPLREADHYANCFRCRQWWQQRILVRDHYKDGELQWASQERELEPWVPIDKSVNKMHLSYECWNAGGADARTKCPTCQLSEAQTTLF